ncbi:MAG TPA: hypothetical protein VL356_14675 [Acidocella sp.]|nr:hypothetical protein [Acidocella sp.]
MKKAAQKLLGNWAGGSETSTAQGKPRGSFIPLRRAGFNAAGPSPQKFCAAFFRACWDLRDSPGLGSCDSRCLWIALF